MKRWLSVRAAVWAQLLGACGAEATTDPFPSDGGTPVVLVGTGETEFEAVEKASGVSLIEGPQGGMHIWVSVRCQNLGPRVEIEYGVRDVTTGELLSVKGLVLVADLSPEDEWAEQVGLTAFLTGSDPADYEGQRVQLWATVTEESGDSAMDQAETVVLGP